MEICDLENYLDNIDKKSADQRLVDPKVREKIKGLLDEASKITNLSIPDLLSRLDFKPKDQTFEALESFLAELRSIFWLRDFGFTKIVPLKATTTAQPDFTAEYSSQSCSVEVFCLTETHEQEKDQSLNVYVNFDPNFNGSKFGRDFMSKALAKKKQLDSVDAKIKVLLCVINSNPIIRLNTAQEMQSHAELLHSQLNWGNNYFVGLLTGIEANGIKSDVIYPALSN